MTVYPARSQMGSTNECESVGSSFAAVQLSVRTPLHQLWLCLNELLNDFWAKRLSMIERRGPSHNLAQCASKQRGREKASQKQKPMLAASLLRLAQFKPKSDFSSAPYFAAGWVRTGDLLVLGLV